MVISIDVELPLRRQHLLTPNNASHAEFLQFLPDISSLLLHMRYRVDANTGSILE